MVPQNACVSERSGVDMSVYAWVGHGMVIIAAYSECNPSKKLYVVCASFEPVQRSCENMW